MKKKVFTVIGGVVLVCALSFGTLLAILFLLQFGVILSIAVGITLAIVAQKLHNWLPPKAVLLAEGITLLIGLGCLAVTYYLDSIDYWAGQWFGGLGEMLFSLATAAVSLFMLITSAICQLVAHKREKKQSPLDNSEKI